jgi:hypothetical protein
LHHAVSSLLFPLALWLFGPKRNEVPGQWRKLHNEELLSLYCSQNIIRVIKARRMIGTAYGMHEDMTNAYKILVAKCEGNTTWKT